VRVNEETPLTLILSRRGRGKKKKTWERAGVRVNEETPLTLILSRRGRGK